VAFWAFVGCVILLKLEKKFSWDQRIAVLELTPFFCLDSARRSTIPPEVCQGVGLNTWLLRWVCDPS